MTVSIKLNGVGFTSYLNAYRAAGNHQAQGTFDAGVASGRRYASSEKFKNGWFGNQVKLDGDETKFEFVAEASSGSLSYNIWKHALSGSLGKVDIGKGAYANFTLTDVSVRAKAIELDFNGLTSTGRNGAVHKIVYSLKKPASNGADLINEINKHDTFQSGTTADETFRGFAKHDTFAFTNRATGHDTITGFDANDDSTGHDVLKFSTSVFANAQQVLAAATIVGNDSIITIDAENTITLKDVSSLSAGDFSFFA